MCFQGPLAERTLCYALVMRAPRAKVLFFTSKICFFKLNNTFFLMTGWQLCFAPSPSLFFTKYFFWGQNTVFSLSEYCFWFLKVGISVYISVMELICIYAHVNQGVCSCHLRRDRMSCDPGQLNSCSPITLQEICVSRSLYICHGVNMYMYLRSCEPGGVQL